MVKYRFTSADRLHKFTQKNLQESIDNDRALKEGVQLFLSYRLRSALGTNHFEERLFYGSFCVVGQRTLNLTRSDSGCGNRKLRANSRKVHACKRWDLNPRVHYIQ